ncbi:MAG: hypothetical protein ACLFPX_01730 [Candidatus Omnitrophota bacterium]
MIFSFSSLATSEAAVSFSASPVQGGTNLRFGRIDLKTVAQKEVRMRITSTDSTQYQVYQRMVEPLTSQSGVTAQRGILQYYALVGSNGSGTLYGQTVDYVAQSDQLLYASSTDGKSDSFTMIYTVDQDRLTEAGQYFGRLLYTVRPLGGGSPQEVYLDVFVEADMELRFEVTDVGGGAPGIVLRTDSDEQMRDAAVIAFSGSAGTSRIYLDTQSWPRSDKTGSRLNENAIELSVKSDSAAKLPFSQFAPLPPLRTLIYSSDRREDDVLLSFRFNPDYIEDLAAGEYQGRFRLSFESNDQVRTQDIDLTAVAEPVFSVELEFDPQGMQFEQILPVSPPQTRRVDVTVNTNLKRPYVVRQIFVQPMANTAGQEFDPQYFMIKTEKTPETEGKGAFPEFVPLTGKDAVIYRSDDQGSPARFEVRYQLRPYPEMNPGTYTSEITYSLEER